MTRVPGERSETRDVSATKRSEFLLGRTACVYVPGFSTSAAQSHM